MKKQEKSREKLSGDWSLVRNLERNGVCCARSLLFQKEVKIVGVDDVDRRVSRKIKKAPKLCKVVLDGDGDGRKSQRRSKAKQRP